MSELQAQIAEWRTRDRAQAALPGRSEFSRALALVADRGRDRAAVLLHTTSGFMNATIIAVAFAVMSLGLNIVVGFAGLLDLGYVAFYALGAYSLGWFGSDFFFKANVHVGVSGSPRTASRHPPQLPADPRRRGADLRDRGHDHRPADAAAAR